MIIHIYIIFYMYFYNENDLFNLKLIKYDKQNQFFEYLLEIKKKSFNFSVNLVCTWSCITLLISLVIFITTVIFWVTLLISSWHYWIVKTFKLFLLAFIFRSLTIGMSWQPAFNLWYFTQYCLFVVFTDFSLEFLVIHCVFDINTVAFKTVFSLDFLSNFLVLFFIFLSIFNELFNFLFRKSSFIIGDGNFSIFTCSFISGWYIHNTIFINFKWYLDLRNSSWSRWNTIKIKAS